MSDKAMIKNMQKADGHKIRVGFPLLFYSAPLTPARLSAYCAAP